MSLKKLNLKDGLLGIDTECTGLNPYGDFARWKHEPARPYAFSFCDSDGNTAYYRWQVDPFTRKVIINEKEFKEINTYLANPKIIKIGHNIGYDLRMLEKSGFTVRGKIEDTIIMAHVVTGGHELSYALKPLAKKYLNILDDDEKDLKEATKKMRTIGKKKGWCLASPVTDGRDPMKADYWMAPDEICKKYAIRDAERTMMFYLLWNPLVQQDKNFKEVYEREMKIFYVIKEMEETGVRLDLMRLRSLHIWYADYADQQLKIAEANGGKGLNFKSPKQMKEKFIDELGFKPTSVTKKGNPQINGDFLVAASKTQPLAKAILEYRGAMHMISGFLNPYEAYRVMENGYWVLHTNFRQTGTQTGRFSASDPNLMQVASETTGRRRTDLTLRPREAFIPRKNCVWYLPDYSQIEVIVFSFLAQEKAMMEAILAGRDFHGSIGERVWGKEKNYEEQKAYYRKRAKLLMFCKLYGGGTKKVAYLTDSTEAEAQKFIAQYDSELPGVKVFMKKMVSIAQRDGKITSPMGRTYFIDPDFSYRAVNYLVQGTSADILKNAMINVHAMLKKNYPGTKLLLTLHDELIIEVPLEYHSKQLMREIIFEMQRDSSRIGVPIPLPVGMKIATERWSKTEEITL